jgi:glyoxylase-like metal-dependent hydrolase (beta-lactamase superfamily II)
VTKKEVAMIEIIPVTGCFGGECHLLIAETGAFLVDTGYAFCAEDTARNIARALEGRPLDCILLTHSHYDHAGGLPAIKRAWPGAAAVASRYAQEIFARRGAKDVMRSLDGDAAAKRGRAAAHEDLTAGLVVDTAVKEGDILNIGGVSIRVMETPGHTKCSVSYYFPEDDLLVLSESTGVRTEEGSVIPAFIVSCKAALGSIARAEETAPRRILIPHSGAAEGADVTDYLKDAREATQTAMDLVLTAHRRGKSLDEIFAVYMAEFHMGPGREYQPEEAFAINTRAMIPRLIAEAEAEAAR